MARPTALIFQLLWSLVAGDAERENDTDRGCRVNAYSQFCLSIEIVSFLPRDSLATYSLRLGIGFGVGWHCFVNITGPVRLRNYLAMAL